MSRFDAIRTERRAQAQSETASIGDRTPGRSGKKAVSGYFSPEMSRALHLLAVEQGTSLQALMGEAFDDLMRKHGRHPFGER